MKLKWHKISDTEWEASDEALAEGSLRWVLRKGEHLEASLLAQGGPLYSEVTIYQERFPVTTSIREVQKSVLEYTEGALSAAAEHFSEMVDSWLEFSDEDNNG